MKVGYVRVSSDTQNTTRQEILMAQLGVEKLYIDVCSGKNKDRPQLQAMMNFVREGDTIIVESISRLARNTRDLLDLVDQMTAMGVDFVSQKETIDTKTPAGKAMLTIFGAISQLERDYIRERQREGIEVKKSRGGYPGRTPIQVDRAKFATEVALMRAGHITAKLAMEHLGLLPATFYRRLRDFDAGKWR